MPLLFVSKKKEAVTGTETIKFFDLFSGIGGFREGLTRAGGFTCIGHCEVDVYADKNYRRLFDTEGEWFCDDARTIDTGRMPDFDLLCAGFPCQAFSIAGKREGFADARGTLFFEIARLLKEKRPSFFLLENVPGLLSHDKGRTYHTILSTLSELGYHVEWKVLNSKDFGVAQSRKRVYIVGYLDCRCAGKVLPFPETNAATLVQVRSGSQGKRVYDKEGLSCTLTSSAGGMGGKTGLYEVGLPIKENTKKGYKMAYPGDSIDLGYAEINSRRGRVGHEVAHTLTTGIQQGTLHFVDLSPPPLVTENARCLNTRQSSSIHNHKGENSGVLKESGARAILTPGKENVRQNGRRMKEADEPMFTITATDRHGVVYHGRIRRLVPRECLRLQGYHDNQIDRMLEDMSDSQLYKQAGNGVTVNVIEAIGRRIRSAKASLEEKNEEKDG
ncbi:DNA (cytosine-5-)-methyltransferase [Hespellia stercorisuis]|uniref:Cytosine-specific methyltransferase n=1 Tax=Hespellia stercorisuis DSM 15480 TaxID=1121950 RepID=A0A1M6TB82_9FIRM|nr:DNA (cytosine-5)-methyltransferase 1 [Hespellia stercorisuis DSM 15480]